MNPRLAIFLTLLLGGCSMVDSNTTETPWTNSPSGGWMLRTTKLDISGPGNNFLSETIQVRQASSEKPVDVVTLVEQNGQATLKVRWRDAKHLQIMYANGEISLQVVKLGDLTIETIPLTSR